MRPSASGYGSMNDPAYKEAQRLMKIDGDIFRRFGWRSGIEANRNPDKYYPAVRAAVSGSVSQAVLDQLENENHHSLVGALTQLGKVRR
jgi:hypothetical protein